MKKRNYALLSLYLGIFSQGLGMDLSIDQVIDMARTSNNQIKVEEYNTLIKKQNEKQALKNLILPPIRLSAEEEWDVVKGEGFGANEIEATIPLFVGGKNINRYRKSKVSYELQEKNEILLGNSVEELAVSIFFEIINEKKQLEILDQTSKAMKSQRERLAILYNNDKLIAKSELLKVEANLEKNTAARLQVIKNIKQAEGRLSQVLNLPLETEYSNLSFDMNKYLRTNDNLKANLDRDITTTTLAQKEQLKVDEAMYDVKITKGDLYPSFYLKPTYTYKEYNSKTGDYEKLSKDDRYVLEVGFNYYFAWGATLDKVRASEWNYEKAKLEYNDNLKGIQLEIQDKYREIEAYHGQSLALEKEAKLLKENLNIDELRYENSLISTYDYLNSVNTYMSSNEKYNEASRNLVLAVMEFRNLYK